MGSISALDVCLIDLSGTQNLLNKFNWKMKRRKPRAPLVWKLDGTYFESLRKVHKLGLSLFLTFCCFQEVTVLSRKSEND